jgi:hypothetical protein
MFQHRVLRRIFGSKRDEVRGEWRKLHNVKLNELACLTHYSSGDQIEKNEMGGTCSMYEEVMCLQGFGGET